MLVKMYLHPIKNNGSSRTIAYINHHTHKNNTHVLSTNWC